MLRVEHISSGYGKKQVLYDVSFEVKEGEIVLLTGGNGSGKSTILKCCYSQLPLWEGNVFFKGEKITGLKTSDLIRKGIVYIPQKNNYFANLTVQENLEVSGSVYDRKIVRERIDHIFEKFHTLLGLKDRIPFNLSGGERQLLAYSIAMMHEAKMILFDEPLAGLDRENKAFLYDTLVDWNKNQGTTFLIVEHVKSFVAERTLELKLGHL